MYYESLLEEIKKGKVSQVYLFYGEEEYLKEEAVERIKKALFKGPADIGFNHRIFFGKDFNLQDFLDELNTFPSFSQKKLLLIKEGERLSSAAGEKIIEALSSLPTFSYLILFFRKIDKRGKLFRAIQKGNNCIGFYPPKGAKLESWVRSQFKKRQKEISKEGLSFLLDETGAHLLDLEKEIEKVTLFVGERSRIELEDLIATGSAYQAHTVYDLMDGITNRDISLSLKILSRLMEGSKGREIIGLFFWQFSQLWKAKLLKEKGFLPTQIGRELGIPEYRLNQFTKKIDIFSKEDLKVAFREILGADLSLKSTSLPPKLTLELLLIKLCGGQ